MRGHITLLVVFTSILIFSCRQSSDPEVISDDPAGYGALSIQTEKNSYTWDVDGPNGDITIQGTITNDSDVTYFARLGDRFSSSIDQERLFLAAGSDGYIELLVEENNWQELSRMMLIEGVRTIALRPGVEYQLYAVLHWTDQPSGSFRFRIEYFDLESPAEGVVPFLDLSNTFEIR